MPMTTTHALVPVAVTFAIAKRPLPWRLLIAAMIAAAIPDLDSFADHLWRVPESSIYSHRGAAHSLFMAIAAGAVAALFHSRLRAEPLCAGVAIGAAMASHGILDMMTNSDRPVAYLWPLSSLRLFADWRPLDSIPVETGHLVSDLIARQRSDAWQLIWRFRI